GETVVEVHAATVKPRVVAGDPAARQAGHRPVRRAQPAAAAVGAAAAAADGRVAAHNAIDQARHAAFHQDAAARTRHLAARNGHLVGGGTGVEVEDPTGVVAADGEGRGTRSLDVDVVEHRKLTGGQVDVAAESGLELNDVGAGGAVGVDDGLAQAAGARVV